MKLVIVFIALLAAAGWYYFDKSRQNLETAAFLIGREEIKVEVADTLPKQIQGLSGRASLCDDCGMIFSYDRPRLQRFTMKGMRFPLDIIFIQDGKIIEIREGLRYPEPGSEPQVVQSSIEADMVLEVNEGFVRSSWLKIGDRAVLTKD